MNLRQNKFNICCLMFSVTVIFIVTSRDGMYDPQDALGFPPVQAQVEARGPISDSVVGPPPPTVQRPARATISDSTTKAARDVLSVTTGRVDSFHSRAVVDTVGSLVREHFVKPGGEGQGAYARLAPKLLLRAIDLAWWRESRNGTDPNWRGVGSAGERGEYQLTPIFIADVERICGFVVDPLNNDQCRYGIFAWLTHYAPIVGAETVEELYQLVHLGPDGFREWKGKWNIIHH